MYTGKLLKIKEETNFFFKYVYNKRRIICVNKFNHVIGYPMPLSDPRFSVSVCIQFYGKTNTL